MEIEGAPRHRARRHQACRGARRGAGGGKPDTNSLQISGGLYPHLQARNKNKPDKAGLRGITHVVTLKSSGVFLFDEHATDHARPKSPAQALGPSGPEKCRGQGAATQTVRMYGKETATPPSAFSQVRVSSPLFKALVCPPVCPRILNQIAYIAGRNTKVSTVPAKVPPIRV